MNLQWYCFVARIASEKSCLSQLCPLLPRLICKTPFFSARSVSITSHWLDHSLQTQPDLQTSARAAAHSPSAWEARCHPQPGAGPRCCSPVPSLSIWSFSNTPVGLGRVKLVHPCCKPTPWWREQWALKKTHGTKRSYPPSLCQNWGPRLIFTGRVEACSRKPELQHGLVLQTWGPAGPESPRCEHRRERQRWARQVPRVGEEREERELESGGEVSWQTDCCCRRSGAELLSFFVLVLPPPAPDSAKAVQQGFQLHLLHLHGQQAIRHYLLRGGLLHSLPPDGAGLLPHLCHGQGARPTDPGAAARGGPHRRPAAPPGPAQHPPHEDWDQSCQDPVHHHGVLLPVLGSLLYHKHSGPFHKLHGAGKAVDGFPVAGLHQFRVEPFPLRLPEQVFQTCLPHHPVLWWWAIPKAFHLGADGPLFHHHNKWIDSCTKVSVSRMLQNAWSH